jgi:hypothetical protein
VGLAPGLVCEFVNFYNAGVETHDRGIGSSSFTLQKMYLKNKYENKLKEYLHRKLAEIFFLPEVDLFEMVLPRQRFVW